MQRRVADRIGVYIQKPMHVTFFVCIFIQTCDKYEHLIYIISEE